MSDVTDGAHGPLVTFAQCVNMMCMHALSTKEPIMVWGPPGIAKSQVPFEAARILEGMTEEKWGVVDIRLLLLEPSDMRGLPYVDQGDNCQWAPAPFFPTDPESKGIIFLDEITAANQTLQKAALQLVQDRTVGEYKLPVGWLVVAAGNRVKDRGGLAKMPKPLENRFMHVEMKPDLEGWVAWAYTAQTVPSDIIAFNRWKGNVLYSMSEDSVAWPTPRSWEKAGKALINYEKQQAVVSKYLANSSELKKYDVTVNDDEKKESFSNMIRLAMQGYVGQGLASEFMAYREIYKDLPNPEDIISGKSFDFASHNYMAQHYYAISTSVVSYLRRNEGKLRITDRTFDAVFALIDSVGKKHPDQKAAIIRDIFVNGRLNMHMVGEHVTAKTRDRWKEVFKGISRYM
jgi:hypothetical protein